MDLEGIGQTSVVSGASTMSATSIGAMRPSAVSGANT
jgi:hypothetical protein